MQLILLLLRLFLKGYREAGSQTTAVIYRLKNDSLKCGNSVIDHKNSAGRFLKIPSAGNSK